MLKKTLKEIQNNEGEEETLNFEKPDFVFIPKGNHSWRQQGYYLVCRSCEIEHATWIGPNKIMVGIDEKGNPILKNRQKIS